MICEKNSNLLLEFFRVRSANRLGSRRCSKQASSEDEVVLAKTFSFNEVPAVFREPCVLSGYRPAGQSWQFYVRSLLQKHNECLNCWTHILAGLLTVGLLLLRYRADISLGEPFCAPFAVGYACCVLLYAFSVSAHLFHSRSQLQHYVCFMLDYAGIGLYGTGIGMQQFYYCSEQWFHDRLRHLFAPVLVLLSCVSCFCSSYYKIKCNRPYPAVRKVAQVGSVFVMYVWINLPLASRYSKCSSWFVDELVLQNCDVYERVVLDLHSKQIFWFLASGVFFGLNIPHRFWPGAFDFVLHGHQLFHLCIMMTTVYANEAVHRDLIRYKLQGVSSRDRYFSHAAALLPALSCLCIELGMIACLTKMARRKVEEESRQQR